MKQNSEQGVMIVGVGGAVASTAIAGVELLKSRSIGTEGLPLASMPENLTAGLADYENLVFGGWDVNGDDLAVAAVTHNVLTIQQFQAVSEQLASVKPLAAVCNSEFCHNIEGKNIAAANHHLCVEAVRVDIRRFRSEQGVERVVVINLASTESFIDRDSPTFARLENFERAIYDNSAEISPALLYAYAAIGERAAYGNFTPSVACDFPALVEYAVRKGVPLAGKDGKPDKPLSKPSSRPA